MSFSARMMALVLAAIAATFALISCQGDIKKSQIYQPRWQVGDAWVFDASVSLTVQKASAAGSPSSPSAWSTQFMRMRLVVDSLDTASAQIKVILDSVRFQSVERDSVENAFLESHLKGYTTRLHFGLGGSLGILSEEPALPLANLGPALVSPAQLWAWMWPTWPLPNATQAAEAQPAIEANAVALETKPGLGPTISPCQWKRAQKLLSPVSDTAKWAIEWTFTPDFLSPTTEMTQPCGDLPWQGLASMQGERFGLGLKEFKWTARAPSPDGALILERLVQVINR